MSFLRNVVFIMSMTLFATICEANGQGFRLKDVTDALQCSSGKVAQQVGQEKIPSKFQTIKFTITVKSESTNETTIQAGLKDGFIVLFPTASAEWKNTHVIKEILAENYSFRKNLHQDNRAACNRRSNFDTGVVDDIATQIQLVAENQSVVSETNIKSGSKVSITNNAKLAASLGIPFIQLSGSYGRTIVRTLDITVVSP